MSRTLLVAGLVALALSSCGQPAPVPAPPTAAVRAPAPVGVQILPANSHVSGVYPPSCRAVVLASGAVLPDRRCTPGAGSAAVTQTNLASTICTPGYARSVTPPQRETNSVKHFAVRAYAVRGPLGRIELDHVVPKEIGGSNDVSNLWPEPSDIPNARPAWRNTKDGVEGRLHKAVCDGKVPLAAAQNAIALDWTTAEHAVGLQ